MVHALRPAGNTRMAGYAKRRQISGMAEHTILHRYGIYQARSRRKTHRSEWKEIIDLLYSHPSIVCWVPFNESWGQFKTPEIVAWTKNYDKSRLVNPASGGNHYPVGDMLDIHHYPNPDLYLL